MFILNMLPDQKGVEDLTLSQFATSYEKCKKPPENVTFNE